MNIAMRNFRATQANALYSLLSNYLTNIINVIRVNFFIIALIAVWRMLFA